MRATVYKFASDAEIFSCVLIGILIHNVEEYLLREVEQTR